MYGKVLLVILWLYSANCLYVADNMDSQYPAVAWSNSLPAHLDHCEPITHSYALADRDGKTRATLHVVSRICSSPDEVDLPYLLEGETLSGSLDLDLPNETIMNAITVSLIGDLRLPNYGLEAYLFAKGTHVLWPTPADGDISTHLDPRDDTHHKLIGTYNWPFTLSPPAAVEFPQEDGQIGQYQLPSSSPPSDPSVYVRYRIEAKVQYGAPMNITDDVIGTTIVYLAKTKPDVPSVARQVAYEGKKPLDDPTTDEEGWFTLPSTSVKGTAFGTRSVEVVYSLSLAKPLSYTAGSVIPLHLSISCADEEALQMLSSATSPNVVLARNLVVGTRFFRAQSLTQKAVWWPASDGLVVAGRRELQGEIHLAPNLHTTSHIPMYEVSYYVALLPSHIYKSFATEVNRRLQTVPVGICTAHADGPRPITYYPNEPQYWTLNHAGMSRPQRTLSLEERQLLVEKHFSGMFAVMW